MKERTGIQWAQAPETHDYPAALSYLSLIYADRDATALVERLKKADLILFKAKDIFRASGLSLLGVSNSHVERDRKKIANGERMVICLEADQSRSVDAHGRPP